MLSYLYGKLLVKGKTAGMIILFDTGLTQAHTVVQEH